MQDLHNVIHVERLISPAAATTDNTAWVSQIVDRQGFDSIEFVLSIGALDDIDATFAVLVEHGDQSDLSDAAAVPDGQLLGTETLTGFTFSDDNETRKIGYVGDKRHIRITVTPSNNTGNAFLSGVVIFGDPHLAPTDNPPV